MHAPTASKKHKEATETFYESLNEVVAKYQSDSLFYIAVDFNARIGAKKVDETCLGNFGRKQARSINGSQLVEFCERRSLFVCNTSFRHSQNHRSTWSQKQRGPDLVASIRKYQIDYVLCLLRQKYLLFDSRSYPGTIFSPDHSLVVSRISLDRFYSRPKLKSPVRSCKRNLRVDVLLEDSTACVTYQGKVERRLTEVRHEQLSAHSVWQSLVDTLKKAASETVGYVKKGKGQKHDDDELFLLSTRHKELRMELLKRHLSAKAYRCKRAELNRIAHEREKLVNIKDSAHLELLATRVAEAGHGAQMFEAVKAFQGKQRTRVVVHNKDGEAILLPDLAAAAIATHFESQFTAPGVTPLPMFTGPPRALNRPITREEVSAVVKKMKPRKATGPDECPIELIKAGGVAMHAFVASVINGSYRHHQSPSVPVSL